MKKGKFFLLIALVMVFAVAVIGCGQTKKAAKQPKQTKQEAKTEDPTKGMVFVSSTEKPDACTSCHVKVSADKDYSLNGETKNIKGHPTVTANTIQECMGCHKDKGFDKVLHKAHLTGGDKNKFVTEYKGSCVQCHKLDAKGQLAIPGLAPAGTQFTTIEVAQVDKAPEGCSSCHKKISAEKDYSFGNELKNVAGHPAITFDDFNQCYNCHKADSDKSLDKVVHIKHLTGQHYKNYGNSCINCHKVNDDGSVSVKGKKA